VSFHEGLITEIDVSFSEPYWDEMLPILGQKYGADWKVDREDMPITNYETKKTNRAETRPGVGPVAKRLLLALSAGAPKIGFARIDVREIRTLAGDDR
jgi:hypothetical protein